MREFSTDPALDRPLQRDVDRKADGRIPAVVHVIPIVSVDNVNVVGFVPVLCPGAWPRIDKVEPIATVPKAREPANHRHTFGSLLIWVGASIVYVKEQMGHSSIQVTVETYAHLIPGANTSFVDRL